MAASGAVLRLSLPYSTFPEESATPPAKRLAPGNFTDDRTTPVLLPVRSASSTSVETAALRRYRNEGVTERFRLYDLALSIYSAAQNGRIPDDVGFPDAKTKRRAYQLVYDVIQHREIIEDLLIESGFYSKNCDLHGQESLVTIMAYDYQDKKFTLKVPLNNLKTIPRLVLKIGEALLKHRVKLNAELARMRVKFSAKSTTQLLSETSYSHYQETVTWPYFARVNRGKVHNIHTEIVTSLQIDGFKICSNKDEVVNSSKGFCQLQRNLVAFSANTKESLEEHQLFKEGYLVSQDYDSYCFVESLRDLLTKSSGDVIVTHCNAGIEVAHIASLLRDEARVIAYGTLPMQMESLTQTVLVQDIKNVQFIHAPFTHADPHEKDLAGVSVVLCLPPSSLSTVPQPVDFICQEGDHNLPLLLSSEKTALTKSLPREQTSTLSHALTFSQCCHIVYAVRSREVHETTSIVSTALDTHNTAIANSAEENECEGEGGKEVLREFVHSYGEGEKDLNFTTTDDGRGTGGGYHVTLLERKSEEPGPTPSEVIARAVKAGLLSAEGIDIGLQPHIKTIKRKKTKKSPQIFSKHKGIPMTISAQNKVTTKKLLPQNPNARRPFH